MTHKKKILTPTRVLALGFLFVIFSGALLLCLPISSADGTWSPFLDCVFTATSATCVTGLTVVDTATHWSSFGHAVILLLIQIGGLGFMTFIALLFLLMRRRITLSERKLIMASSGNMQLSGVMTLIKKILIGTLIFESIGAALLTIGFLDKMPFGQALWYGVFHSISAFCNAGFDLMGAFGEVSMSAYVNDPLVSIVVILLIVIGGIGFLVWDDVLKNKLKFRKYTLHSKIVLTTTITLIFGGALLFFLFDHSHAFEGLPTGSKILASIFQSVTSRTAGFLTVDQNAFSNSSAILTMILMYIGGSPGSTAGGIKTTTFAVLFFSILSCARNDESTTSFKRKLANSTVKQASAIASIYLVSIIAATIAICALESFDIRHVMFEVISAIGTVGLSSANTALFGSASRVILILLMYAGRIGGLSFIIALSRRKEHIPVERPTENILIG